MKIKPNDVRVPADVPKSVRTKYIKNFMNITRGSGRLMLFAGDQKIEHLNKDFYGEGIHSDDNDPEHLFKVANKAKIGCFATQLGLISRYGMDYKKIQYVVKLNSKTNLVKTEQKDPCSQEMVTVDQVVDFQKNSGLKILGVGYTIYLGSEFEADMLTHAAQIVNAAHKKGLVVVFWIYPRGRAVKDEKDPHLIAGACGVAACLGSDFVKVNYPKRKDRDSKDIFREAILAAGRTNVVCAGGSSTDVMAFLQRLRDQIDAGAAGNATGRNIHQKGFDEAVRMCNAIYAITVDNASVVKAVGIYNEGG